MPVEFHCTSCAKLLRTPDESAGKKAKCPQCGAIVDVPDRDAADAGGTASELVGGSAEPDSYESAGSGPLGSFDAAHEPQHEAFNPYASPTTDSTLDPKPLVKGELVHRRIEFDSMMRKTWAFFTQNMGPLALFGVTVFALNAALQVIGQVGSFATQAAGEEVLIVLFAVFNGFAGFLFQTYISVATSIFMLKMARTRQAEVKDIFLANKYFLRGLGLTIVIGLIFVGVLLLCALPALVTIPLEQPPVTIALAIVGGLIYATFAIILGLRYSLLSYYFLVDRDLSIGACLSNSAQFMNGNKLTTFLIGLVVGFLGLLFMCLTCFLGQILYIPYFGILTAILYLSVTGQPWEEPETT